MPLISSSVAAGAAEPEKTSLEQPQHNNKTRSSALTPQQLHPHLAVLLDLVLSPLHLPPRAGLAMQPLTLPPAQRPPPSQILALVFAAGRERQPAHVQQALLRDSRRGGHHGRYEACSSPGSPWGRGGVTASLGHMTIFWGAPQSMRDCWGTG